MKYRHRFHCLGPVFWARSFYKRSPKLQALVRCLQAEFQGDVRGEAREARVWQRFFLFNWITCRKKYCLKGSNVLSFETRRWEERGHSMLSMHFLFDWRWRVAEWSLSLRHSPFFCEKKLLEERWWLDFCVKIVRLASTVRQCTSWLITLTAFVSLGSSKWCMSGFRKPLDWFGGVHRVGGSA